MMLNLKNTIMKRILLFAAFTLLSGVMAMAQDVITKKNGEDIKAKVLEVGTSEVRYKLFEEPNGATYSLKKTDILLITYETGRKEVFNERASSDLYYTNKTPVDNVSPGMKYKELKNLYNYKEYIPGLADRYSPAWMGVASFFIPGLGECINGEWGRGLGKFGGELLLGIVAASATYANQYGDSPDAAASLALACYAGIIAIDIWSIIDAVRIAKVKNMYEQDLKRLYSFDLKLSPSVNYIPNGNTLQPVAGMTLAFRF